jgi:hypothetical protein
VEGIEYRIKKAAIRMKLSLLIMLDVIISYLYIC